MQEKGKTMRVPRFKYNYCRGRSVLCTIIITFIIFVYIKEYNCPLKTYPFEKQALLSAQKVNPFDYEFIINGEGFCSDGDDGPFLLIFVLSEFSNTERRQAIRQTWGSPSSTQQWVDGSALYGVKVVFMFGVREANDDDGHAILKEESRLYGDVVQADFIDSYNNLTTKTLSGIKWASIFCQSAKYIMKSDDDVFLHIPNWISALKNITSHAFFLGINACHNTVHRSGKWAISTKDYPFPFFPKYINGFFYVFPAHMASQLVHLAQYVPNIPAEDAVFTGILRHVLGADLIKKEALFCRSPALCDFRKGDKAGIGATSQTEMQELWQSLKTIRKGNHHIYLLVKYFVTHFFWEIQ